jgi:DNA-binding NarL/FixJ family response regulator
MAPPRILLVDDQRQVSRVLRSALEVSSTDYIINDVSSAEEALLDISRGPFDLLVTDLRLPGMTGLELVERVLEINPKAKSILITGDPTEEVRRRAEALGVIAFLRKPIGTNMFLEIVEHALAEVVDSERKATGESLSHEAPARLMDLRQELGAEAVLLINAQGKLMARAGENQDLDIEAGLPSVMAAHKAALSVSRFLRAEVPSNFHHFDGETHDIYLTNVGEDHVLLMVFRGRQEAGQMGAVVHFGRRAAEGLLALLVPGTPEAQLETAKKEQDHEQDEVLPVDGREEEMAKKDIKPEDLEEAAKDVDSSGAESFWEQAVSESPARPDAEGDALTYEEARKMGLVDDEEST